jgi:hypothetical protein
LEVQVLGLDIFSTLTCLSPWRPPPSSLLTGQTGAGPRSGELGQEAAGWCMAGGDLLPTVGSCSRAAMSYYGGPGP